MPLVHSQMFWLLLWAPSLPERRTNSFVLRCKTNWLQGFVWALSCYVLQLRVGDTSWHPHRYIGQPLLLEGKKFDVRSYLLIACTAPYVLFFAQGYVRLTCSNYDATSDDLTVHLTNQVNSVHLVQKKSRGVDKEGMQKRLLKGWKCASCRQNPCTQEMEVGLQSGMARWQLPTGGGSLSAMDQFSLYADHFCPWTIFPPIFSHRLWVP